MRDYIELPMDKIIKESQTTEKRFCDKKYVVYININDPKQKVHINTEYFKENNVIKLCKYYDRGLCDTVEEYERLNIRYIEAQAYGSWMDGAK